MSKLEDFLTPSEMLAMMEIENERYRRERAEKKLERERKNKKKVPFKKILANCIGCFALVGIVFGTIASSGKIRVAIGTTHQWGAEVVTSDGNVWHLEDAPEYIDNTKVLVVFDTKGTKTVEDDEILTMY